MTLGCCKQAVCWSNTCPSEYIIHFLLYGKSVPRSERQFDYCCRIRIKEQRHFLHHGTTTWKLTRWSLIMQSYGNRHGLMKNHTCTTSTFIFSCCVKFIFSRVAPSMGREHPQRCPPNHAALPPPPTPLRRRPPHSALHSLHAPLIILPSSPQLMTASCISRHSFMPHRSPSHSCTCLHKLSSLVAEENSHSFSVSSSFNVS